MNKVKVIGCLLLFWSVAIPVCPAQTKTSDLKVSFIVPGPELKDRKEEIPMHLSFRAGQAIISPDYKNNKEQLAEIHSAIEKIVNDSTFVLKAIQLCGFASPEGNYEYNTSLSFDRAQALKEYLSERYPIPPRLIEVGCQSEDWEGLHELVAVSDLSNKQDILSLIVSIPDPDDRDGWIWQLDEGTTYRKLLADFYPPLRRVKCETFYRIIPFTVEEGKRLLTTFPDRLSLYEFYLIAASYPVDSENFESVFFLALQSYPQEVVANNNMAAIYLERNKLQMAHKCLDGREKESAVQNNLGVLYAKEGRRAEALRCFERAAAQGCKEAVYNIKKLRSTRSIP